MKRILPALCACAVLAAALLLFLGAQGEVRTADAPAAQTAGDAGETAGLAQTGDASDRERDEACTTPLFPSLSPASVTALSVTAGDRRFEFLCSGDAVSVNGQMADGEIFSTLLDQILTLPVAACAAFSPEESSAMLTLVVTTADHNNTVHFYKGSSQETARVLAGTPEEPVYGVTKSWRIGTLLLVCDGTRIQDESGNETPAR